MMDPETQIYALRKEADSRMAQARRDYELADAWIGLDSLLRGAWGAENVDALGGGREAIERAHRALGSVLINE